MRLKTIDGPTRATARLLAAGALGMVAVTATAPAPVLAAAKPHVQAAKHVKASDADNGKTVTLRRGGTLALTLHSTYWTVQGSSDARVLVEKGSPATRPALRGCVPGGGCGTVSATFVARGDGNGDVTASRTSCGEALACSPAQQKYVLHIVVTG